MSVFKSLCWAVGLVHGISCYRDLGRAHTQNLGLPSLTVCFLEFPSPLIFHQLRSPWALSCDSSGTTSPCTQVKLKKKTGNSLGWFLLEESAWCPQVIGPCSRRAHSWHLWEAPCQKWRSHTLTSAQGPAQCWGPGGDWDSPRPCPSFSGEDWTLNNVLLCVSSLSFCALCSFYFSVTFSPVPCFLFLFSFISLFIHSTFSDITPVSAPFLGDTSLEIGQDEGSSLAVPGQRSSSFSF